MEKKDILKVLFVLGFSVFSFAQNGAEWEHYIGNENTENALNSITEDSKGNIITLTTTKMELPTPHHNVLITKMNSNGTLIWEQNYGSESDEIGVDVVVGQSGEIIVLMNISDAIRRPNKMQDLLLVKFTEDGTVVWQKTFGGSSIDRGGALIRGSNNDFWVGASTLSKDIDSEENNGSFDQWIININADGQLLRSKLFGGGDEDFVKKIRLLENGKLLVLGHSTSTDFAGNYGDFDIILSELSPELELNWVKGYGGEALEFASDILIAENHYFIVGKTASEMNDVSNNSGFYDAWIVKLNQSGKLIEEKTFGGEKTENIIGIEQKENGNLILAGTTHSEVFLNQNNNTKAVFTIELSEKLGLINAELIKEQNHIEINDLLLNTKGNLYIGGAFKVYSEKPSGWLFASEGRGSEEFTFQVHPNPSEGELYVNDLKINDEVFVFDVYGNQKANFTQLLGTSKRMNLSSFVAGVYFIRVLRNGKQKVIRWVKK